MGWALFLAAVFIVLRIFMCRHRPGGDLRTMSYQDYLQTEHWQQVRKAALKRAGYRCQLCNRKGVLHVHHRTYIRRGHELPEDLIVLCRGCHETFHQERRVAN
jgi:replicative DNA helicase